MEDIVRELRDLKEMSQMQTEEILNMKRQISMLVTAAGNKRHFAHPDASETQEICRLLPITSRESFENAEEKLRDESNFTSLVSYIFCYQA